MHFRADDDGVRGSDECVFVYGLTDIPERYFRGPSPSMVNHRLFVAVVDINCTSSKVSVVAPACIKVNIRSTLRHPCRRARAYPSMVLSPTNWCPTRYVLCELEMK